MQNVEHPRFDKQDQKIENIKDSISEISNQLSVMSVTQSHTADQMKEVLTEIKKMREEHYKLTQVETLITSMMAKNTELENLVDKHQEFFTKMNDDMQKRVNFKTALFKNLALPIAVICVVGALAWVIDFIYRVKIH
jgi:chromosome segregation ATPase